MKKKLLIIGSNSAVSKAFIKNYKNKYDIYSTYSDKGIKSKKDFKLDLSKDQSINEFCKSIKNIKFSKILVCSGIIYGHKITQYTFDQINNIFNINTIGLVKLFSKVIFKNTLKKTTIIFISSISGRKGSYDETYASSKSALIMLAKSISKNYGRSLRVNVIAPSVINNTKMHKMMSKKNSSKIKKMTPNNQLLNLNDFSKIINDIFQDHWHHSNGAIIDVNGGIF